MSAEKVMSTRVYECMRKVTTPVAVIRLWLPVSPQRGIEVENRRCDEIRKKVATIAEHYVLLPGNEMYLAKEIVDNVPDINAVEVLGPSGDGALVYPSWP